ncbi:MAG: hypothetical protein J3Q66DRAFT_372934 [Benniella sp.]|nr:MAG: hypothetical protein J3Q66DRAFT_372934 [Benniella sp.]
MGVNKDLPTTATTDYNECLKQIRQGILAGNHARQVLEEYARHDNLHDVNSIKGHQDYVKPKYYCNILRAAQRSIKVLDLNVQFILTERFELLRKTLRDFDESGLSKAFDEPPHITIKMGVSQWVQEVLESCPSLEYLTAKPLPHSISATVSHGCFGLKELRVMINMEFDSRPRREPSRPKFKSLKAMEVDCCRCFVQGWKVLAFSMALEHEAGMVTEIQQGLCRVVFRQLGQLEQLRILYSGTRAYSTLPLKLRMRLDELSRLRDIEVIGFLGYQDMNCRREVDVANNGHISLQFMGIDSPANHPGRLDNSSCEISCSALC